MRSIILTSLLSLGFIAGSVFGADAAPAATDKAKAENTTCCCGKAVDAKAGTVECTVAGKKHVYGTCGGKDCMDEAKNSPDKFEAGVEAHSKKP